MKMTELTCLLRLTIAKELQPICGYAIRSESLRIISRSKNKVNAVEIIQFRHI